MRRFESESQSSRLQTQAQGEAAVLSEALYLGVKDEGAVPISQGHSENRACHTGRGLCECHWAPQTLLPPILLPHPGPQVPHRGAGCPNSGSVPALLGSCQGEPQGPAHEPSENAMPGAQATGRAVLSALGQTQSLEAVLLSLPPGHPGTCGLGAPAERAVAWLGRHSRSHQGKTHQFAKIKRHTSQKHTKKMGKYLQY